MDNRSEKKGKGKSNIPDGTSLGRKAGNGPPCFIARVTERASRIDFINWLCFSLQFAFRPYLDYSSSQISSVTYSVILTLSS